MHKPVGLIILDGFGCRKETFGNAVKQAYKPNFDRYMSEYPNNRLVACGEDVGLPAGQMGNSEVGHLNIGAGRIVYQSLTRINKSIESKEFYKNKALNEAIDHALTNDSTLHIMGLLSDGGVHSHYNHMFEIIKLAKEKGVKRVYVHGFLDGRDVDQQSALTYIDEAERQFEAIGLGEFKTISGRYYAMDRDRRYERTKKTHDAIHYGAGPLFKTARTGVERAYEAEIYDEFVSPFIVGQKERFLKDNDSMIFYNFRPDRAVQLSKVFAEKGFDEFLIEPFENVKFTTFTKYDDSIDASIVFEKEDLVNTIGEVVSNAGMSQLRIAETEKYPHVTYFMSGGRHEEFNNEERILVNSPKVATYDLKPEMSAYEVKDKAINRLKKGNLDMMILNFANPDMVGHSGMLEPTIKAVETVDECLGEIVDEIISQGGVAVITADHGNADEVVQLNGEPMTAHTTNDVPVIVTKKGVNVTSGRLADLAPTVLDLLGIDQPKEMTGKTLLQ